MSLVDFARPRWQQHAACRGMAYDTASPDFFTGRGQSTYPAKVVCAGCPVRAECLEWSLDTGAHHGIWGGLSERERRRLRRTRAGASARAPVVGEARIAQCGTASGYQAHFRHDEKPCADCKAAHARDTADRARRRKEAVA